MYLIELIVSFFIHFILFIHYSFSLLYIILSNLSLDSALAFDYNNYLTIIKIMIVING